MQVHSATGRVGFIDVARFYGIILVYYGHFIESAMNQHVTAAAMQYKFIYSFHMPLFFILAGYVAKDTTLGSGVIAYVRRRIQTRLVPYIFFAVLLIIPTLVISGNHGPLDLSTWQGYLAGLRATFLWGLPSFNIPTWFLLCIFTVEMIHLAVGRFFTTQFKLIAAMVIFYLAGSWISSTFDLYNPLKGRFFSYFYLQEGITVYAFYLFGIFLRRNGLFAGNDKPAPRTALWAITLLLVVYFTYDLNKGHFTFHVYDAVVALFSSHGQLFWFALTAIAGSLMVLSLARATPAPRWMSYLGGNTLVLFCLNGFFYHFVNDPLAKFAAGYATSGILLTAIGLLVTAISILLAAPFIPLLHSYLPWLVGNRQPKGKDVLAVTGETRETGVVELNRGRGRSSDSWLDWRRNSF